MIMHDILLSSLLITAYTGARPQSGGSILTSLPLPLSDSRTPLESGHCCGDLTVVAEPVKFARVRSGPYRTSRGTRKPGRKAKPAETGIWPDDLTFVGNGNFSEVKIADRHDASIKTGGAAVLVSETELSPAYGDSEVPELVSDSDD